MSHGGKDILSACSHDRAIKKEKERQNREDRKKQGGKVKRKRKVVGKEAKMLR